MSFDPELFGQAMGAAIQKAVAPLREEVADLRKQLAEAKSVEDVVRQAVADEVAKLPAPKDADEAVIAERVTQVIKGDLDEWKREAESNIKTPEIPDIQSMVDSAVSEAVKVIPVPKDGNSITLDDVAPLIGAAVDDLRDRTEELLKGVEAATEEAKKATKEAFEKAASLRQPEDGKSLTVEEVRPIIEDQIERAVAAIPKPKDGIGMAGMLIDRDGNLIATLTNGEAKNLGPVAGKDGVSLGEFDLEYLPDTHEVRITAQAGGARKSVTYPAGGIHGKGYWRDGNEAQAGEAWTHDGCLWVAREKTRERPSAQCDKWFLAARKGRDGESVIRRVQSGPAQPIRLKEGSDESGNA